MRRLPAWLLAPLLLAGCGGAPVTDEGLSAAQSLVLREALAPLEEGPGVCVRPVLSGARIDYQGRERARPIGRFAALAVQEGPVADVPMPADGAWRIGTARDCLTVGVPRIVGDVAEVSVRHAVLTDLWWIYRLERVQSRKGAVWRTQYRESTDQR